MSKQPPVFTAFNRHVESCGNPPDIRSSRGVYYGYFENKHSEQWVLQFDTTTGQGKLSGGDIGWDEVVEFDLHNDEWPLGLPAMNPGEAQWLMACLEAAMGQPVKVDVNRIMQLLKERTKNGTRNEPEM